MASPNVEALKEFILEKAAELGLELHNSDQNPWEIDLTNTEIVPGSSPPEERTSVNFYVLEKKV